MSQILLGYRRKSQVRNDTDLVSPEQQQHSCDAWAQTHLPGCTIEWYEDISGHRSGRDEKGRPGWQRLMAQLDRPEVAGVISWSFDRMYRNVHQFLSFLNRLESTNKRLITVKESFDTSTALGRALVTILMVIAQLESDQTSERIKTGITYRREVQGRHWGRTPFGCGRDDHGQLIPSPLSYWLNPLTGESSSGERPGPAWEERRYYDALLETYEVYSLGSYSYDMLARYLNLSGWRFMDSAGQPRLFQRNDIYRSVAYWRLFRGELPTGPIQRKRGPVLAGGHGPILPVELCNRVGLVLAHREHQHSTARKSAEARVYLLSPVVFCGTCGRKLTGAAMRGRQYYRHQGGKAGCPEMQTPADDLEAQALDYIVGLCDVDLLAEIRAEGERVAAEAFSQAGGSSKVLSELDRQRGRLSRLENIYLDGDINRDRYRERKAEITELIAKLEADLYAGNQVVDLGRVIDRLLAGLDQIRNGSPEAQKVVVNSIFERIEVVQGKITHVTPRPWAAGIFRLRGV